MTDAGIRNSFFQGKRAPKKTFFIAYGPPSSGKSSVMVQLLAHHGVSSSEIIEVNVDAIINKMMATDNVDAKQNQETYWRLRSRADDISSQILDQALLQDFHVAWETTGRTVGWTIKEIDRIRRLGYRIVLVYPVVHTELLLQRMAKRTAQINAPEQQVRDIVDRAAKNIVRVSPYLDELYIYDNSEERDMTQGSDTQPLTKLIMLRNTFNGGNDAPVSGNGGPGWVEEVVECDCAGMRVKDVRDKVSTELADFIDTRCKRTCQE